MKSPFNKSFCGKSPLNELTARQEANLPEALKTAIEAKSPTNYGSPLNQDPDRTKYQDSIQKLHKPAYDEYLKRKTEGYSSLQDIGAMSTTYTPPETDPTKVKSLKDFAYAKEVGKGGTVKDSEGRTAYSLAKKYR